MHSWKHVLDASEFAIGQCANSRTLGCDRLGEIRYFDHAFVGHRGEPVLVKNAICMHEEDNGIAYKHTSADGHGGTQRQASRGPSIFTVGNYDYGIYYYLGLAGSIDVELLTGIVAVSAVTEAMHAPEYAPMISRNLASPIHQHLFCMRFDVEFDGGPKPWSKKNSVVVDDARFKAVGSVLKSEMEVRRNVCSASGRARGRSSTARASRGRRVFLYRNSHGIDADVASL